RESARIQRQMLVDRLASMLGLSRREGASINARSATAKDLANWTRMFDDTRTNETIGRGQAHAILASSPGVRPEQITKQVYQKILHVNLDDPYMGLGPALHDAYPFKK